MLDIPLTQGLTAFLWGSQPYLNPIYNYLYPSLPPGPVSPSAPNVPSSMKSWTTEDLALADAQASYNWRRNPYLRFEGGLVMNPPGQGVVNEIRNPSANEENTWDSLIWKSALAIGGMLVVGIIINRR